MPTLITRGSKGSELSHAELDANFKRTISQKTATYTALISDNRSVIECVHATVAFTVTLGDAATMATGGTGDYEITIINIGAAVVTVARAGTDTIDGAATSLTLNQYDSVTLKSISAGSGYMSVTRVLGGLTATVEELNYVDGVTSDIQTQIGAHHNLARGFKAYTQTVDQALTGSTKLIFNTELYDINGEFTHDADSSGGATESRFTPTVAGLYLLTVNVGLVPDSFPDSLSVGIMENGVSTGESSSQYLTSTSGRYFLSTSAVVKANGSTDYYEATARAGATGVASKSPTTSTRYTTFAASFLGTA